MRRYWIWGAALILAISMILVGCGGKKEQTQIKANRKSLTCTLGAQPMTRL